MTARSQPTIEPLRLRRIGNGVDIIHICHFKGNCRSKHHKTNPVTTLTTCVWPDTCNQKETMTIQEAVRRYGKHKK